MTTQHNCKCALCKYKSSIYFALASINIPQDVIKMISQLWFDISATVHERNYAQLSSVTFTHVPNTFPHFHTKFITCLSAITRQIQQKTMKHFCDAIITTAINNHPQIKIIEIKIPSISKTKKHPHDWMSVGKYHYENAPDYIRNIYVKVDIMLRKIDRNVGNSNLQTQKTYKYTIYVIENPYVVATL